MISTGYGSLILTLFLLAQRAFNLSEASKTPRNASLTDLSKCKLTQFGTDYMGSVMRTAGGIRCQMWHSENPLHKVSAAISESDFPERSLQLARNYCRNPNKDPRGPWCYTMEPTLIDDACEIPLCNFGECRISGTGAEYGGTHDTTSSGRKCKSWDKRLKLAVNKTEKFSDNHFPDLSRNKAKNFCRNPDSSSGGPWCYVDAENYDIVEKEYCSVPFCDDKDCLVYSKNASIYSTLTSLNSTVGNISIWIKLWNPADEQIGQARLLFSNLQVPASAKLIAQEWRAGVEIVISNSGSGQEYPRTDDETDYEETPNILLGSKWTALWVAWGGGFISVGHHGSMKPIFLDEFKKKNTISSMYPESFFQYGIMGTGVLWSMEFCEDTCEVHMTFGVEFIRFWPLLQTNSSHDLQFHVRASHMAAIQLTQTPAVPFPCLLIFIGQNDATLVMYQEKETSIKEILLDIETKNILNFWAWHEFTISIFGPVIQMFWHRDYGREEIFSVEHHIVQTVRWFSIGTENTIAHWTLFCAPTEADAVEAPWFPNCVASSSDARYEGSQWTSENQIPCIPWISDKIPKDLNKDDLFIDGSALKALNKCRNPTNDPEGPFCYTAIQSSSSSVKKQHCPIRKCRSSECRMAGTANDYLGTLSVTRSGRQCVRWMAEYQETTAPKKNTSVGALIVRALASLKVKRENTFRNSILDVPGQRWDEIGLRSRLPRELESELTRWTPRQRRVTEIHKGNGIHKLARYQGPPVSPSSDISSTSESGDDDNLLKSRVSTSLPRQISKTTADSSQDNDNDLFNLKRATFPKKPISTTTSTSPEDDDNDFFNLKRATFPKKPISTTTSTSPEDDDNDFFNLKRATFPKKPISTTTSTSPEDDDNDFFNLKRATFPKKPISTTTSTSPEDDDNDFFNLKRATFPKKPISTTTSTSPEADDNDFFNLKRATFPKKQISTTTSTSPEDDDNDFFNLKRATFPKKPISTTTSTSPEDDDNDFFNLKRTTFPKKQISTTTSTSPEDDDNDFFNLKRATFPKKPISTTTSTSPEDDDNDFFNLKRATFPKKPISTTTSTSPEDDDNDFFNLKRATFPKKPISTTTSTSPEDDDNDFFNLKRATFPKKPISTTTSTSPEDDDNDFFNLKRATFPKKPISTTTSTSPEDDDNDFFNLKRATFPKKPISTTTSTSPEDDDNDFFNLKRATFPKKPISTTTSTSPEADDNDFFNLKRATFPKKQISTTTSTSPEDDDNDFFNLKRATFPKKPISTTTSTSPEDDDNDFFNLKRTTFPKKQISTTTSTSPEDDDNDFFNLKRATFPKKPISTTTSTSTEDDNNDFFNLKRATFPKKPISTTTSTSPEDDDNDFFNLKRATFPKKPISMTTAKSPKDDDDDLFHYHPGTFRPYGTSPSTTLGTTRHQDIEGTTSESPEDDDDLPYYYHPGTFQPYGTSPSTTLGTTRHQDIEGTTSESPEDDDDLPYYYHPGTFQPYGTSPSTTLGTTRHQDIEGTTSESPEDDDDLPYYYHPGTFQPYGTSPSTTLGTTRHQDIAGTTLESPEDDDDLPYYYHPGTFQPYGTSPSTTLGTTRHQDIAGTTLESPEDDDDLPYYYHPGTFQPYGTSPSTTLGTTRHQDIEGTTSESPEDDDDLPYYYHPGTFQPYGTSPSTTLGTTRHQDIEGTTSESPEDDDDLPYYYHPGTFQPYGTSPSTTLGTTRHQDIEGTTSESPEDDDDFPYYYHPGTFQPYGTSPSTTLGTTRHQDIAGTTLESPEDDDDLPYYYHPGTFQPYGTSHSTTLGTTRHQDIEGTTSESPEDDDDLLNQHSGTFQPDGISEIGSKPPKPPDRSTVDLSLMTPLPPVGGTSKNSISEKFSPTTLGPQLTDASPTISTNENTGSTPINKVDPRYLNDTLYPEQNAWNASNYCRNPSRNIAGTWCYTTDPEVPQDLCNVRDCEKPEECIFLVRGHGTGRRLYVLPEYRSEGLHFSLKEWEPDHPDSITFVILSEDDVQSRLILKVGAMKNEKVLLYYETKEEGIKLVKQKTLPHLLYLGKWTGFVLRMDRGGIKLYYEGAPYPLFEWEDPEPAEAFLPIYYYYSSELGNSIGVAFNCDTKCHIEQTTTSRFSRILPISIWEKEETPSPHRLVLMLRGEGIVLLPLLMLPTTPGYYALTIGEMEQWVFFIKNKHPNVHILHKQDANGPLFTTDTWTNITIQFHNYTIQVLRNGTEVLHYVHNLPLLFYFFSLSVDKGGWVTWAANCIPTDIDGAPLDGGWSEWGPWSCSASCNGGTGIRKRTCDNPEPNIRGQPCLGPSMSSGRCNMNKCGDVTDVTLALIKKRIRLQHKSIIIKEGDSVTLSADTDIVTALRNETPTFKINWSRNGIFLDEEEDRVKLEDTAESISYAVVNDSGVYTQTLHRVDDSQLIFKIITLAVIPARSEVVIRETLPFSVTCHCVVLGYVYSDLKVSWILNGKVFKDYGVSTPIAVNVDHIPKANFSHHGEWRCEVVQSDLSFKWTTNVITVSVLGLPNWRTHLMEDKLTRPIFGWMPSESFVAFSAFFLTILIIVAIVGSTIWYLRFQESLKYKDPQKKKLVSDNEESFSESENEKLIAKKKNSR